MNLLQIIFYFKKDNSYMISLKKEKNEKRYFIYKNKNKNNNFYIKYNNII